MPKSVVKQGNDAAVQGTNDSSIVSKCSIATLGYFDDDYLCMFVAKATRRSPLINRGYYIRVRAIDDALKYFLSSHSAAKKQILSLGAGFDSTYFRLHSSGHLRDTVFYEIDFPEVAKRKATMIRNNARLRQHLEDEVVCRDSDLGLGVHLTSATYHLLGIDLADLPLLDLCLAEVGLDRGLPTFVLSECVLTYMNIHASNAVIGWTAANFNDAVFMTYEQIHPDDAFGLIMRKHFDKLNSPLRAICEFPSIADQIQRFKDLGWQATNAVDMNTYFNTRLPLKERRRVNDLEPFDEFEEWHLKCNHYAVVVGCNGLCSSMDEYFTTGSQPVLTEKAAASPLPTHSNFSPDDCVPGRFGHASSLIDGVDRAIVVGGFGEAVDGGGGHARLGGVAVVDLPTGNWMQVKADTEKLGPRMHHTLTAIPGGDRFFLFGGRSSPTHPLNSSVIIQLQTAIELAPLDKHGDSRSDKSVGVSRKNHRRVNNGSVTPIRGHSYQLLSTEPATHQCGELPFPRWRHSAVGTVLDGSQCVVVYGGRSTGDQVFGDCWTFHVSDLRWTKLEFTGNPPPVCHSHTACLWRGTKMVIAGGLGPDLQPLTSVHIIDIEELTCQEVVLRPTLPPRYSHTSHVIGDNLLLVGGVHPEAAYSYTITIVSLVTATWQQHTLPTRNEMGPLLFHNHSSELNNDDLIILGGGGNCFSFGTHLNRTPVIIKVPTINH